VTHGARDERVPVAESDAIVTALTTRGRPPMYTRYAALDHASTCEAAWHSILQLERRERSAGRFRRGGHGIRLVG